LKKDLNQDILLVEMYEENIRNLESCPRLSSKMKAYAVARALLRALYDRYTVVTNLLCALSEKTIDSGSLDPILRENYWHLCVGFNTNSYI